VDYDDPGWAEPLRQVGFGFLPWRATRRGKQQPAAASILVGLRVIFLGLVLALLLFLFVLSFLFERGYSDGMATGADVLVVVIGLISFWTVSILARRPLRTESVDTLSASYRTALFVQIATAEVPALAGFIGSFVADSLWPYTLGLAFALAGLYLAAPSRRNIEQRQERIGFEGSPLSLGRALTSATGPPDRPDVIPR
jgi:ABC-type transport system involved in cytochrome c biogenesis permease subunit